MASPLLLYLFFVAIVLVEVGTVAYYLYLEKRYPAHRTVVAHSGPLSFNDADADLPNLPTYPPPAYMPV